MLVELEKWPSRNEVSDQVSHESYFLDELNCKFVRVILLHGKFLQFDWLRAVVFQLNLKYLHVKITKPFWVVV